MEPHLAPSAVPAAPGRWRGDFKRSIVWVLIAKLIGLFLLWLLFFSPAHRTPVDDTLAERQLSLAPENADD